MVIIINECEFFWGYQVKMPMWMYYSIPTQSPPSYLAYRHLYVLSVLNRYKRLRIGSQKIVLITWIFYRKMEPFLIDWLLIYSVLCQYRRKYIQASAHRLPPPIPKNRTTINKQFLTDIPRKVRFIMSILPSLHPHADITRGELFYFFRAMPLSSCSLFTLVLLRALKSLQLAIWLQRAD